MTALCFFFVLWLVSKMFSRTRIGAAIDRVAKDPYDRFPIGSSKVVDDLRRDRRNRVKNSPAIGKANALLMLRARPGSNDERTQEQLRYELNQYITDSMSY